MGHAVPDATLPLNWPQSDGSLPRLDAVAALTSLEAPFHDPFVQEAGPTDEAGRKKAYLPPNLQCLHLYSMSSRFSITHLSSLTSLSLDEFHDCMHNPDENVLEFDAPAAELLAQPFHGLPESLVSLTVGSTHYAYADSLPLVLSHLTALQSLRVDYLRLFSKPSSICLPDSLLDVDLPVGREALPHIKQCSRLTSLTLRRQGIAFDLDSEDADEATPEPVQVGSVVLPSSLRRLAVHWLPDVRSLLQLSQLQDLSFDWSRKANSKGWTPDQFRYLQPLTALSCLTRLHCCMPLGRLIEASPSEICTIAAALAGFRGVQLSAHFKVVVPSLHGQQLQPQLSEAESAAVWAA